MTINYREATLEDMSSIMEMWLGFQEPRKNGDDYYNFKEDCGEITEAYFSELITSGKGKVFVAEREKEIIGIAVAEVGSFELPTMKWKKEGKIRSLLVKPGNQGKGIGKELLTRLETFVRGSGAELMTVFTDFGCPAESFYAKNGMKKFKTKLVKVF